MKIKNPEENLINILIGTILNSAVSELDIEYATAPIVKDEMNMDIKVLIGIKSIRFEIKKGA